MIEPEFDGRGEGYGKYKGLTIAETRKLFDGCVQQPSMRSISAVLRITREQLEARGQLGIYPVFAWIAGVIAILALSGRFLLPSQMTEMATKAALGSGSVFVILLVVTVPTRKARKGNLRQEAAIRDEAVKALTKILEAEPELKPLTIEQETTVKILLRKAPGSEPLRELL